MHPRRFSRLIGATLAAWFAASGASAEDTELAKAADAAFVAADHDNSGKVSWEEFRNRVVAVFGHLDQNEDGRIVGDEHPPAVNKAGTEVQPGTVTAESFAASIGTAFKAADKDGDGELSAQEWSGKQP